MSGGHGGDGPSVVLIDGVCNLCHRTVRFVIPRDPGRRFVFASLQSEEGRSLLRRHGLEPGEVNTVILLERERVHQNSAAVLRILRRLRAPWPLLFVLILIPRPVRDAVYSWIASRRYRWFGRTEECQVPAPEHRDRFLDLSD